MTKLTNTFLITFIFALMLGCNDTGIVEPTQPNPQPTPTDTTFYRAVDLSFQPEANDWQTNYYDAAGNQIEVIPFFADHGVNLVRLRLWYAPEDGYCNLSKTIEMAKECKQSGMNVLLCIQYSDTWADPGNQSPPLAWQNLDLDAMKDSVYAYTRNVMLAFKSNDIMPAIVQIGNETNSGFLWDHGRVGGSFDDNWNNYIALIARASTAIRDVDADGKVKIMMHYAGLEGAEWYFGKLAQNSVDYNYIGISYYAIWHGKSLDYLKTVLSSLASTYKRKVFLNETAYPWTLEWNDWTNNPWGENSQLISAYPATPEGQKAYLQEIKDIMTGFDKGLGFCYWAPDWVAFKGSEATDGSTWENATLFDFDNKALPAFDVFAP